MVDASKGVSPPRQLLRLVCGMRLLESLQVGWGRYCNDAGARNSSTHRPIGPLKRWMVPPLVVVFMIHNDFLVVRDLGKAVSKKKTHGIIWDVAWQARWMVGSFDDDDDDDDDDDGKACKCGATLTINGKWERHGKTSFQNWMLLLMMMFLPVLLLLNFHVVRPDFCKYHFSGIFRDRK